MKRQRRREDSQNAREFDPETAAVNFEYDWRGTAASKEEEKINAIGGMNIEGLSVIDGIEHEIPGEVIDDDQDRGFSAFRDPENSDVEEAEVFSAI